MTKKHFKKEYTTPITEVCGSQTTDLLCQSSLVDAGAEGFIEDGNFSW